MLPVGPLISAHCSSPWHRLPFALDPTLPQADRAVAFEADEASLRLNPSRFVDSGFVADRYGCEFPISPDG